MVFRSCYQSQRSTQGKAQPSSRGLKTKQIIKDQWSEGILHWQCYGVQTRQIENRSRGGTLESFILRERLSTVIISSWRRLSTIVCLRVLFFKSRWRSIWKFYSTRATFPFDDKFFKYSLRMERKKKYIDMYIYVYMSAIVLII